MKERYNSFGFLRLARFPAIGTRLFSFAEATVSEKVLLTVAGVFVLLGLALFYARAYPALTTPLPAPGGSITEGIVGIPRFINPLFALSDADRDLLMLTFAGLMRPTGDGRLVPELAERYEINDDGTVYTFYLKKDLRFHDGAPLTADDVLFTIALVQDPAVKSNRRADWEGVTVEKVDDYTVRFILKKPYAPFLENTTIGILPKHLWEDIDTSSLTFSTLNTQPVGAGPFTVTDIQYDASGIPTAYVLTPFRAYALGDPYLDQITIRFFSQPDDLLQAFRDKTVDAISGVAPRELQNLPEAHLRVYAAKYPRVFAVFLNPQKNHAFTQERVRKALDAAIDKQALVQKIFHGYAEPIASPVPPFFLPDHSDTPRQDNDPAALLEAAGWEYQASTSQWYKDDTPLRISLVTADTHELAAVAEFVANQWQRLGVPTTVTAYKTNDLNQNIIRTRDYEALLFGEVIGRTPDLFAFWHSSQREDPGLNIALYTNAKVDTLLERARKTADPKKRKELFARIDAIMREEVPAVFLYTPDFIYLTNDRLRGVRLELVSTPSDRFAEVHRWYQNTNRVWKLLAPHTNRLSDPYNP